MEILLIHYNECAVPFFTGAVDGSPEPSDVYQTAQESRPTT